MKARDIPNLITALRILLVVPIVVVMLQGRFGLALLLFFVAGFSDGLDGFLAKRFGWTSRLGGVLDPLADKALLISTVLTLGGLGLLPVWLVAAIILRDLVILAGAITYHLVIEQFEAAPTRLSKLNTLMQILLVLVVVAHHGVWPLPAALQQALVWLTLLTTVSSGVHYVWVWSRRAAGISRKPG